MDRAPNFEGFVVPKNNETSSSSHVSSMVVRPNVIGHDHQIRIGNEQQGPSGSGSSNFYHPTNNPLQHTYPTNPLFGSNPVYGEGSQQQQVFNLPSSFEPDARLMQRMSSPNFIAFPAYQPPPPYDRSIGYGGEGMNANVMGGGRGAFTSAQLMELQNQTFIFKYISANVPVPPHLLTPLRNSLYPHALPASAPGFYFSSPVRWGSPNQGYGSSSGDTEPGRCRRTDGKKWRCARDAIADQKYCERHMNRGRHRARRTAEAQRANTTMAPGTTTTILTPVNIQQQFRNPDPAVANSSMDAPRNRSTPGTSSGDGRGQDPQGASVSTNEGSIFRAEDPSLLDFGIFPSDSFVDPSQRSSFLNFNDQLDTQDQNSLRHFIDDWPDHECGRSAANWADWTSSDYAMSSSSTLQDQPPLSPLTLSQEIDPVQMGLGTSSEFCDFTQNQTNPLPFNHGISTEGPSNEGSSKSSSSENVIEEGGDGGPV